MNKLIVKKSIEINAPVARVWEALTKPEFTQKYMYNSFIESDWKVGGPFIWKGVVDGKKVVHLTGELLKFVPNKSLHYTCFWPGSGLEDKPENTTTVTYELSYDNDKVLLEVTQGDFSTFKDAKEKYKHASDGWDGTLKEFKKIFGEK